MLLNELRTRRREEYRKKRCRIPGKLKPTIICPECNRCAECPYPEYRDMHRANNLSWEGLIETAYEGADTEVADDEGMRQKEIEMEFEAVCKVIDAKNPLYTKAIVLKEYYDLSVAEIAKKLDTTERNVYFYLRKAKKIGKQYKEDNY